MEKVKIILLEGGQLPKQATELSAGYDLYAPKDTEVKEGRSIIKMGFKMQLPRNYVATIRPRSGYSAKGFEFITTNGTVFRRDADVLIGTIDADYTGEVGVIISNRDMPFHIKKGQRIAQMVIQRYEDVEFEETTELDETERGEGGFSHTGSM